MDLKVTITPFETEHNEGDKRQYFPYEMTWVCPRCSQEQYRCFAEEYLSYPTFGQVYELTTHCDDCDQNCQHPFVIKLRPRLTLELVE